MFIARTSMFLVAALLAAGAAFAQVPDDLRAAMRRRLWVLEVWARETGTWMVLVSQVTTAKPQNCRMQGSGAGFQ